MAGVAAVGVGVGVEGAVSVSRRRRTGTALQGGEGFRGHLPAACRSLVVCLSLAANQVACLGQTSQLLVVVAVADRQVVAVAAEAGGCHGRRSAASLWAGQAEPQVERAQLQCRVGQTFRGQ